MSPILPDPSTAQPKERPEMNRLLILTACLISRFCQGSFAQEAALQTPALQAKEAVSTPASSPAAYIYVAAGSTGSANHIVGYAAAANGRLTPINGSPFVGDVVSLAGNGKYVFGSTQGTNIDSFIEESNGVLKPVEKMDAQRSASCQGGGPGALFLDHTGATLYDFYYNGQQCADSTYQSFEVQKQQGSLQFLGSNYQSYWNTGALSFIGSNRFAYSAVCDVFTSPPGPEQKIYGFERQSNGMLTYINVNAPLPAAANGRGYCPSLAAADPTNHVAISVAPFEEETLETPQLATYTADKYGNLSTSSTAANMPKTQVLNISALSMSPSGKLLAVGGNEGLQIFHFNGGEPITKFTGLLAKVDIEQMFWDNSNHLYAISTFTNKLYVFTATPTGVSEAPGSPYAISIPQSLLVQPKVPLL